MRFAPFLFLLLWSSGFTALKLGLADAEPFTFLALRYLCAVALLVPLTLIVRPRWPTTQMQFVHLAVIGVLVQAFYFSMTYLSIRLGLGAGTIALVTSLQPILVTLAAPAVAGERVEASRWLGLLLGLGGAMVTIVAKSDVEVTSSLALGAAVLALLALTGGTLYEKRFGTAQHPLASNLVQYAVGLIVVAPFALSLETLQINWTPQLIGSLAYLVICNSLVAMTLLFAMIRAGQVSRVSSLFFLVPPGAALVAWIVLGEHMPPLAWGGFALAAVGVYLATRQRA
ncbi:DMT family transporter [Roseiterribacter gracilis]|uniref:Peptide ABC transporter ATP-binding protein n=1 Tax=Roseiterribacter gracilis TaxID=2812848 RepID=A0A8S8XCB6_9PROT|nr:peptide ABC transporter ATP-binding protein [Rhodospirillales bacterium TMPK1]